MRKKKEEQTSSILKFLPPPPSGFHLSHTLFLLTLPFNNAVSSSSFNSFHYDSQKLTREWRTNG